MAAVEQWDDVADGLEARAEELEEGTALGEFAFDPEEALAPLPRSPQWLDGSVFQTHLDLMARALHPDKPNEPTDWPYVYQGASDDFLGSRADIAGYRLDEGIDFEGEFAVIVGPVPMRTTPDAALAQVRLLMLCNDVSLRAYAGPEVRVGFGFLRAKPSTVFSSVAVTPDELGGAWRGGRVHLPLRVERSGEWFGHPHGSQMTFHFGDLVAHTATTRRLSAGTIVGSGTVSNDDRSVGSACIAAAGLGIRSAWLLAVAGGALPLILVGVGILTWFQERRHAARRPGFPPLVSPPERPARRAPQDS